MPFGRPGHAEFGTYFVGYAADLSVIERMLQRMFVGVPEGQHDRLLDFSTHGEEDRGSGQRRLDTLRLDGRTVGGLSALISVPQFSGSCGSGAVR